MKRHEQLQPLSRQHHNGLLAALLLKKGIRKAADPKDMAAFILDFWYKGLEDHFKIEEDFLIPAVANTAFDTTLLETLREEHALLRSCIYKLQDDSTNINVIEVFTDLLEQHIRFEERILFPAAEKSLTGDALQQLGNQLHHGDIQNCINYPIKFWE